MCCLKVIGLTGSFCAGAGTAAKLLSEMLDARVESYSDKLREIEKQRGMPITRESHFALANELRCNDPASLSKMIADDFGKLSKTKKFFVAEKLRSRGDFNGFKQKLGGDFILLAIDAPLEVRYLRAVERRREGEEKLSLQEFVASEKKENRVDAAEHEQNIAALMQLADYTIVNDGSQAQLKRKLGQFAKKFSLA